MSLLTTAPDCIRWVDWGRRRGWYLQFGVARIGGHIGAVYLYENAEPYYIRFNIYEETDMRKGSPGYGENYTSYVVASKRALTADECDHFWRLVS